MRLVTVWPPGSGFLCMIGRPVVPLAIPMESQALTTPHQPPLELSRPVVHVVDDEPAIQSLFSQMLEDQDAEVRLYSRASDFLSALDESRPGCLVLDLKLPDMSGLEVLQELSRRESRIPVVFMSGLAKVSDAVSALKLGSLDFVEKPFAISRMTDAINRALEYDRDRRRAEVELEALRSRLSTLTPRETEVMGLVVKGHPNKVIASILGVSPKTVEVHRANVMRKTKSSSLAELVKLSLAARGESR
ncbi:MAG: response regulator FixJ [Planctomycetota bacterium]